MKYLAFLLLFFSILIPGTLFAAEVSDCDAEGFIFANLKCSCFGETGDSYTQCGSTSSCQMDSTDDCKAACEEEKLLSPSLKIEGYAMQCAIGGEVQELAREKFSGESLGYAEDECETAGNIFTYPHILCSCPESIPTPASFPRTPESANECRSDCLEFYIRDNKDESLTYDRDRKRVLGYSASCVLSATGKEVVLGQETFTEDSLLDDSRTACIGTKECLCPTNGAPSFGLPSALSAAGLQTTDANTCADHCNIFILDNPTVTFTNQWQLRCEVAEGPNIGSANYAITDSGDVDITTRAKKACGDNFIAPQLGIQFPGFQQSANDVTCDDEGNIESNLLGLYVNSVYQWLVGAGALIAVVMIMVGGLQWMMARGNSTGVGKAKTTIGNALFGLTLLLFAYTIAFWVNPDHVQFDTLKIEYQGEKEANEPTLAYDEEDSAPSVESAEDIPEPLADLDNFPDNVKRVEKVPGTGVEFTVINVGTDPNIDPVGGIRELLPDVATALSEAAKEMKETHGTKIRLTSAQRTRKKQAELFFDNCLATSNKKCNPATCSITTRKSSVAIRNADKSWELIGPLKNVPINSDNREKITQTLADFGVPSNCPHTSFIAVDAWCATPRGGNWTYDPDCQVKLTEVMISNGFCRLASEAWHFEYDAKGIKPVSGSCKKSNVHEYGGHTPDRTCDWWKYVQNKRSPQPIGCKKTLPN